MTHPQDDSEFHPPAPLRRSPDAELVVPAAESGETVVADGASATVLHVFLVALRRWGLFTIPAGLALAAAAASAVWWFHEPVYEASAWFQISSDNSIIDDPTPTNRAQAHVPFVETQVELVRSPLVLGPVIQDPQIARLPEVEEQESPLDWLKENVDVLAVGQSEFVQIRFRSTDKEAARKIVDAISQQYLQVYHQDSTLRRQQELELLQQEKDRQAAEIAIHRDKVRTLHRQTYGKDPFVVERTEAEIPAGSRGPDPADVLQKMLTETVVKKEMRETNLRAFTSQIPLTQAITEQQVDEILQTDQQLQEIRQTLAKREAQLKGLRSSPAAESAPLANSSEPDHPVTSADRRRLISRLEAEISGLASQLAEWEPERRAEIRADLELAAYRESLAAQVPELPSDQVRRRVDADPEVLRLASLVNAKKEEVNNYRELLTEDKNSAALRRLTQELQARQETLDEHRNKLAEQLAELLQVEAQQARLAQFDQLVGDVRQARAEHAVLKQKLAAAHSQRVADVERAGEETIDLEFARQALQQAMEMHQMLAQQLVKLKTEARAPDRVALREAALVSEKPVKGLPIRNMVLAALSALMLPAGLATLWEWQVKRISDADQFELELGIPILGEITRLPGTQRATFASLKHQRNRAALLYEQSTLVLSDNISHSSHLKDVRVIAISSAVKGEGKSHLAAKLALNLARIMPGKVLLMDGDLRFRSVERLLGLEPHAGLVEALHGDGQLKDLVHRVGDTGLHVLTAGSPEQRSYDLLRDGVLPGIVARLRQRYRYVIIDTPPILSAGESLSFGKVADGTLICALRDKSRIPQTRRALVRLLSVGVRPLGAVLAGVPSSRSDLMYYGYGYLPASGNPEEHPL